ncbi:MAG: hypothetical protein JWQ29_2411 [Phenylobacterium sp.]|nr:hypothetical protein [Phenylobacterium sp.]
MRARSTPHPTPKGPLCAALALAAAGAIAAPAAAQTYVDGSPYVDELVVTGPSYDGRPARLSRAVSIADLDLSTPQDRAVLRLRVRDTARDLCRALGETGESGPLVPSCEDQARRDATPQMRVAINRAYARRTYASLAATDPYAMPYPY